METLASNPTSESNQLTKILEPDVLLAQKGNVDAYSRLIKRCQNTVTSIALSIVKNIDDSEEVAQQVFIAAWQNLTKLKNTDSFLPWLRQTTRYKAINYLRDNRVVSRVGSDEADSLLAQISDPSISNDEQLITDDRDRILQHFIDLLESEEREIVLLYYREEQSSQHVAELLGISPTNVRQKLSRVRKSLKQALLENASDVLIKSVPALSFSALIAASIVPSSPVAAATLASGAGTAATQANMSPIAKFFAMLGGAALGGMLAILAVIWSNKVARNSIKDESKKQVLKKHRNILITWIAFCSILLVCAYELTSGWIAPTLSYIVFAFGLVKLMLDSMKLINEETQKQRLAEGKPVSVWPTRVSYLCLVLSICVGFAGLFIGLIASGRF